MSYQVKQSHYIDVPDWASNLKQLYWVIRVEKHSRVKRRRYYRYVFKEKLRLVETGLDQDLVNAVCRYLCELSVVSSRNLEKIIANPKVRGSKSGKSGEIKNHKLIMRLLIFSTCGYIGFPIISSF